MLLQEALRSADIGTGWMSTVGITYERFGL